ncbi:MAG: hypothetical protein ACFE0J_10355 [Elainellaceae cyanobacterium]
MRVVPNSSCSNSMVNGESVLQTVWKWLNRVLGLHREGDRSMHSNRLLPDTTQQRISEHDKPERGESLLSDAHSSERSQGDANRNSQADHSTGEAQISRPQKESLGLQAAEPTQSAQPPQSSVQQSAHLDDGQKRSDPDADEPANKLSNGVFVGARLGAVQEDISAGAPSELLRRCNEQEARINSLRQQLKELRPTATIGEAWLKRGQASAASSFTLSNQANQSHHTRPDLASDREQPLNLQDRLIWQNEIIAGLEHDVKETRRLSTIGEARLNRWRNRTFSS